MIGDLVAGWCNERDGRFDHQRSGFHRRTCRHLRDHFGLPMLRYYLFVASTCITPHFLLFLLHVGRWRSGFPEDPVGTLAPQGENRLRARRDHWFAALFSSLSSFSVATSVDDVALLCSALGMADPSFVNAFFLEPRLKVRFGWFGFVSFAPRAHA